MISNLYVKRIWKEWKFRFSLPSKWEMSSRHELKISMKPFSRWNFRVAVSTLFGLSRGPIKFWISAGVTHWNRDYLWKIKIIRDEVAFFYFMIVKKCLKPGLCFVPLCDILSDFHFFFPSIFLSGFSGLLRRRFEQNLMHFELRHNAIVLFYFSFNFCLPIERRIWEVTFPYF